LSFGFGGLGDQLPYQGWEMIYDSATLKQIASWCTSCGGGANNGGSVWQGSGGDAVDAEGNHFLITGNGDWNGRTNFGQSFVELSASGNVRSFMTPANWADQNEKDLDFGAGRPMLLGDFALGSGKDGRVWLLNRSAMGGLEGSGPGIAQTWPAMSGRDGGVAGGQAFANGSLYLSAAEDHIRRFVCSRTCATVPAATTTVRFHKIQNSLAYSSNGSIAGTDILWAAVPEAEPSTSGKVDSRLWAFNATTLVPLWISSTYGKYAKFSTPTVVNGQVYVSTFSNRVTAFGVNAHVR
jgi:hypothetical protein